MRRAVFQAIAILIIFNLAVGSAIGATVIYSGSTSFANTFDRYATTGGSGRVVPYHSQPFYIDVAGSYTLRSYNQTGDGYIFLYEDLFDPNNPSLNFIAQDDDDPCCSASGLYNQSLLTGTQYYFVTGEWGTGYTISFTNSIDGPGTATLGTLVLGPAEGFAEVHTSIPEVAFSLVDSFQGQAGGRMMHLRQSGHDAFAMKDPLDGLMLASAGDVQDIGPITADGEKSKNFWGKLYGVTGDVDGDDTIAGYDYSVGGFVLGGDYQPCKGVYLGAMAGISSGRANTDLSDDFDVTSYQLGLYSSYENGPYYLDGVLSYARSNYETSRSTTMGTARGDYDGDEWGAAAEFGYVMSKDKTVFEPYIGTQYIYVDQESFSETGAGTMNMAISSRDTYSWKVMAGGRISGVYEQESGAIFVPELHFAYKHELGDDNDVVTTNFVTSPAVNNFVVKGLDLKRESIELGVGFRMLQADNVDFDFDLTTEFNGDQQAYIASVGLKYSW